MTSPQDVVEKPPETVTGTETDIGVGLAQAVAELNQAPPGSSSTVGLLADAAHAPGDGSRFPITAGPAWDKLAEVAAALRGTRTISSFAILLAPNSGVDLLAPSSPARRSCRRDVHGDAEHVPPTDPDGDPGSTW